MSPLFDSAQFRKLLKRFPSGQEQEEKPPPVVDLYRNPLRKKEREHLDSIFARLPDGAKKRDLKRDFLLEDAGNHYGAWSELMMYDWFDTAKKNPVLEPTIPGSDKTPDLLIELNGQEVFVEVFAVQRSYKDQGIDEAGRVWWPAATGTFQSMGSRLDAKMSKYAKPIQDYHAPFVVCVLLPPLIIQLGEVKTYFLGGMNYDLVSGESLPALDGVIFERQRGKPLLVKHRHVSGVLVARRSGATVEKGYKLNVGFIQNPYTFLPVSPDEFGNIRRFIVVSESDTSSGMGWL